MSSTKSLSDHLYFILTYIIWHILYGAYELTKGSKKQDIPKTMSRMLFNFLMDVEFGCAYEV